MNFFLEVSSGEKNFWEQIRDPQGLKYKENFLDFCSPGCLFQVYVLASVPRWIDISQGDTCIQSFFIIELNSLMAYSRSSRRNNKSTHLSWLFWFFSQINCFKTLTESLMQVFWSKNRFFIRFLTYSALINTHTMLLDVILLCIKKALKPSELCWGIF